MTTREARGPEHETGGPAPEGTAERLQDTFRRMSADELRAHLDTVLDAAPRQAPSPEQPAPPVSDRQDAPGPTGPEPRPALVHERFAHWAARTPAATALVDRDTRITYAELAARADRIAHRLRANGVGPGVLVGVSMDRSADLVAALLGVLKAGGCYVPLDPSYPERRLRYLAEDSGVTTVLVSREIPRWWSGFTGTVLDLAGTHEHDPCPATPVAESAGPDDPAYLIYTSGSTGRPKGVVVPHRNVSRLFTATEDWFGFGPQDVWTLFHSYAFDFSVWEMWGALAHGGRLVVVPYETSRAPDAFLRLLREQRVTVLNQTPSAFHQLIRADADAPPDAGPLALRYVIFGGEALDPRALADWCARHGDATPQLINMYGITETTVHVTYRPITLRDVTAGIGSVIGRPLPDLDLYVLDPRRRPVPAGETGELYVGGAGLAHGYAGKPGLTAERFVPHPFATLPGQRLYRTGDLVRVRPDGDVEYRGRLDSQVQLRGFRVELGEIESVLAEHPAVHEAVVVPRTDDEGHVRLAAYVTVRGPAPAPGALRTHAIGGLPAHMVPSVFTVLPELPLTEHGKVDRERLPVPDPHEGGAAEPYAAPRDRAERVLADAWSQVLGVDRVGIDDNYFGLGGDSILSIRMLALARKAGLELAFQDLLEHQTVRTLAAVARDTEHEPRATPVYEAFSLLTAADRALLPEGLADAYPMTRLQQGMLFHSDPTAPGAAYHNVSTYRLRGPFSERAWREAVSGLLQRHDVLRTSFDLVHFSEPLQLVHRRAEPPLTFEDLRGRDRADLDAAADRRFGQERAERFDWRSAPLIRFHVQRRTDDTHQLFVTEHHAILDGWSERSLFVELLRRYADGVRGTSGATPPAPAARFASFVESERASVANEADRRFWADQLAGATFTPLPRGVPDAEKPAGPLMRIDGRWISPQVYEGLRALGRQLGVSLRIVLLAAHLRVMSLLSGSDDVVTGVIHNGRSEEQDGDLTLGLFLNTLPMRGRLTGGTWRDLVRHTAELDRAVQPHRRHPLAEILRGTNAPELFETFFNYTHFHVERSLADQSEVEVVEQDVVADTHFPFGVEFLQSGTKDALGLGLRFDASLFTAEQVDLIHGYYVAALTALATDGDARYETTDLLSAAEHRTIQGWNDTAERYDRPHVLHTLVAEQARRTPDATAVRFDGAGMTYRELDERADRLARLLRAGGVRRGSLVAVVLDRSAELPVSLLAVLKAGGTYVPLDPEHPPRRLREILTDAGITMAVARGSAGEKVAAPGVTVVRPDAAEVPGFTCPPGPPEGGAAGPEDGAYMIFTSGSTGKPKGVLVSHGAIANRLLWLQRQFPLRPGEPVLQKTPATFDVSVWEFFWPLFTGGVLVVARPGGHRDPAYLAELIVAESVTTVNFVPSMLRAFLEDPASSGCTGLTRVLCAGEALPYDLQRHFQAALPAELHNIYGPTEADLTHWRCTEDGSGTVPIGWPIANSEVHVLDRHGQRVPQGVTGELYLAGAGLAEGYHRRPDLTEASFIQHTDHAGVTRRMYRTGDLVRHRPDGALEFRGRADAQLKLRGHRIEPGEIEAVLRSHADVLECAVLLHEGRLAAYFVADAEARPDAGELAAHAASRLPAYMVPTVWSQLDAMPLTGSGKVDRKALPSVPGTLLTDESRDTTPPRDAREARLLELWSELLGGQQLGVHADFFAAGGHSLLATRLVSRIRSEFGAELSIGTLFEKPTVAELAAALDTPGRHRPALVPTTGSGETPLSFAQEWFRDELDGPTRHNITMALRLTGSLDRKALEAALQDVVARHETLRTVFPFRDGEPRQHVVDADAAAFGLPVLRVAREEVGRAVERESHHAFVLSDEIPWRAHLLAVAEEEHVLVLVVHHIASDGWSEYVLGRDISAAYAARVQGDAPRWTPPPVRYTDYTHWQRDLLGDESDPQSPLRRQLAYWKARLAGAPEELTLRTDRPRPAVASRRGGDVPVRLPAALHRDLIALADGHGASVFMVLQSALAALLHRMGAGEDIPIGTAIAGRTDDALEGLVGFFVNTLVLRHDLSGEPSFSELLKRTRTHTLAAYDHQDLPFERLVEELVPDRSAARNPLFQVKLVLHNTPEAALDLPGLTAVPVPMEHTFIVYDINIHLYERFDSAGRPAGLEGNLIFATDLFDRSTVEALVRGLAQVLTAASADPGQPVSGFHVPV
ncbi:amino acid adenylation domain-containing protein [Streptomyces flavofungini]|uniref:amino acid adenylation domain-containing protein n=1 Tax=Streptomyces flavofungini TaxID=68200 RepID=UPI0025AF3D89|nr:non-ribosomal peptide synthetase [Streptomyces flavofungini]WJV50740.1 amino acid adenylation domain-containing protein [Streptomyces flavofungini]